MKFSTAVSILLLLHLLGKESSEAFLTTMTPGCGGCGVPTFRSNRQCPIIITKRQLDIVDAVIVVGDEPDAAYNNNFDDDDDDVLAYETEIKLKETIDSLKRSIEENEVQHLKIVEKLQDEFKIQESNFRTRVMELEEQLKHATTTTTAPGDQNETKEVISSSNEDEGTNEVVSTLRAEVALLLQERMELKRQLDEWKEQRNETTITNDDDDDDDATLQQQQQRLVKLEQELMALNERYSIELAEVQHQLKAEQDLRHEGESVLTQSMESLQQQYALLTEQRDGLQQELQTLQDTHATELVQLEHQIRSESQQTTTEGAALRAEIEMQSNQLAKLELQWKELQQLHASEVKDLTAQWKTEQALRLEQERSMALELHRLEQKYKTDLQKARTMGNHQNNVVGQSQYRAEKIQYDMTSQLHDQKRVLQDLQSKLQTTELELQAFTTYTEALVEERNSLRKLAQQSVNVVKERVQTRWSKIWGGAKRGKKSEPRTMTENDASTTAEVPVYLQSKLEMTELQSQTITTNTEDVVEERNSRIQLAQQSWNVVKGKLQTRWSKISGAKIWKKSKPNNTEDDASISGQVPLYWQE